jgi:hypothetical protein
MCWFGRPAQSTIVDWMSDSIPARSKLLLSSQWSPITFCCDAGQSPSATGTSTLGKVLGVNGHEGNSAVADVGSG